MNPCIPINSLKTSLYIVIFTILISLVFMIFNQIDTSISARYYTPGAGFTFNETELAVLLKHVVRPTFKLATILSLLFILLLAFLMPQAMKNMRRHALFLFTCLALGPALMVEGVLKIVFGQPRPQYITEFGGDLIFSPAWVISGKCSRNCSFVSGDVSGVAILMAIPLIVTRFRHALTIPILALTGLTMAYRVLAGKHFLSDAVISACLTIGLVYFIHYLFYQRQKKNIKVSETSKSGKGQTSQPT
jgi:membrane-associated phospholipid phosphatase